LELEDIGDDEVDAIGEEMGKRKVTALEVVERIVDVYQEHTASVEYCTEEDSQHGKYQQADEVPQKDEEAFLVLELVNLIRQDIPDVGS
jgi:hypothetical protein